MRLNKKHWTIASIIIIGFLIIMNFMIKDKDTSSVSEPDHDITYTCSMHPQVRSEEPGRCPICGMDLIPLEPENSTDSDINKTISENAMALADIKTSKVKKMSLKKTLLLPGEIKVDESRLYDISAWFPGRIDKLHADETGMFVKKRSRLATLYSPEIISSQREYIQALSSQDKELIHSVENKLRLLGLIDNQIEELKKTRKTNEMIDIYSKDKGIVLKKDVLKGEYVKTGQKLYSMADISKVWGVFEAYESDSSLLDIGQKVKINIDAFPDDEISGVVTFISPVVNEKTNSIKIRVEIDNPNNRFKPGMTARAKIEVPLNDIPKIAVPSESVLQTGKRALVYVLTDKEKKTFQAKEVSLGKNNGEFYLIEDGLKENEEIVYSGTFFVDSSLQLAGRPSLFTGVDSHNHHSDMKKTQNQDLHKGHNMDMTFTDSFVNSYIMAGKLLVEDKLRHAKMNMGKLIPILKDMGHDDIAMLIKHSDSLEKIRNAYRKVSKLLITSIKEGQLEKTLYIAECTMKGGGRWLQDNKDIRNPYQGKMMPGCGTIIKEISGKGNN